MIIHGSLIRGHSPGKSRKRMSWLTNSTISLFSIFRFMGTAFGHTQYGWNKSWNGRVFYPCRACRRVRRGMALSFPQLRNKKKIHVSYSHLASTLSPLILLLRVFFFFYIESGNDDGKNVVSLRWKERMTFLTSETTSKLKSIAHIYCCKHKRLPEEHSGCLSY